MITAEDIQAKSDQMNAVDFVNSMLFRIVRVDYNPRQPQPILIHLNGCEGRPYKPCKSMLRGLAKAWGMDEQEWVGKMIELYSDPDVMWAGQKTGGIRVSGISGITKPFEFTVQLNRSQRKIQTLKPLPESDVKDEFILTHWEDAIKQAKTDGELDVIVNRVKNGFSNENLAQIKPAVIAARSNLSET